MLFATFSLWLLPSLVAAHPEGFSGLRLYVRAEAATAALTLHTRDLSAWFPPGNFPNYVADVCAAMERSPGELLELRADGAVVHPSAVRTSLPEVGLIQVEIDYPIGRDPAALDVWSKHLMQMPRGHQQLLFAVDARSVQSDAEMPTLYEATLSVDADSATIEVPPTGNGVAPPGRAPSTAPAPRRISFFMLGVEHIVTGYDHLLFLAGLLLVCRTVREAVGVVTFFTVAHSITLSLAVLNVVRLPADIVEPAIAASIVYVGLENLFGRHRFAWRAAVTFGFGLLHGLGFASALREVGLGTAGVGLAGPLLKFSVGLEAGQLCIAIVLLRVLLALRKRPAFETRWVPVGSIAVSLVGLYWLVTRLLGG